jgi:acylphosphatase
MPLYININNVIFTDEEQVEKYIACVKLGYIKNNNDLEIEIVSEYPKVERNNLTLEQVNELSKGKSKTKFALNYYLKFPKEFPEYQRFNKFMNQITCYKNITTITNLFSTDQDDKSFRNGTLTLKSDSDLKFIVEKMNKMKVLFDNVKGSRDWKFNQSFITLSYLNKIDFDKTIEYLVEHNPNLRNINNSNYTTKNSFDSYLKGIQFLF